ncbi:Carbohydrate sulfotransferase 14 [Folsomia candida]|uniref:Carbohydrate sulfotransferase n=1 Tax=Folsomia candida TaxID=158441 RepID=A0A226F501_FOLCA|nr:Carbohydrate sulfotransferase 14 [Folsomia candida]
MSRVMRFCMIIFIVILFFGTWLLGSFIVIQIDSEQFIHDKQFKVLQKQNQELQRNVDKQCRLINKKELVRDDLSGDKYDNKKDAHKAWERARKEKVIRDNLIYFPHLNQMWCLVPKAASTSWSKAIVDRLNFESTNIFIDSSANYSLQVILKQNFGNINRTAFVNAAQSDKIKKVLLIRHPFSRIASAYRDKLADRKAKVDGMHFFQQFGVKINRRFRQSRKDVKQKEPTFQEFVDYLIETKPLDMNEHWQPISLMCGLCHVHYDHIIAMENLEKTKVFHLNQLGFPGNNFPVENKNSGTYSSQELFRNISNSRVQSSVVGQISRGF